jgi:gamma-glutamyl:cysteine ligase YbdK (ATP-grasp superfamily)
VLPWSAASPAVPHAFGASLPYTVAVEEELFLVDRAGHQVARVTDQVLARAPRFTRGRILGEMCDGVVELAGPVCADAAEAAGCLRALRADVMATPTPAPCWASRPAAACTSTSACPTPRRRSPRSTGCAARAGFADSLAHVERLLAEGNGADRQRAAFARGGLPAVLRHLADETALDRSAAAPPAIPLRGAA